MANIDRCPSGPRGALRAPLPAWGETGAGADIPAPRPTGSPPNTSYPLGLDVTIQYRKPRKIEVRRGAELLASRAHAKTAMNGKRVGLYLRVSTGEQTIETQRMGLVAACEGRGWRIVEESGDKWI